MKRTIAASQLSFFFKSIAVATIIYYVPIYLEVVNGNIASNAGLHFVPYSVAFGLRSCLTGLLVKKLGRYYHVNLFIQACSLAGTAFVCTLSATTPAANAYGYFALLGVGYGGAYVTRLMGLLSAADPEKQAVVQATSWTINSTGNSIGIAVGSVIFSRLYIGPLTTLLQGQETGVLSSFLKGDFSYFGSLPDAVKQDVVGIYMHASRGTFYFAVATAILASGSSLFMEDNII